MSDTPYPTLLVTHGIRQAFFEKYPSKHPSYDPQGPYQMELNLEQK